jgi:hypothetical protein
MSDPAPALPPPDPAGPPWLKDAIAVASDEARRFAGTALGFMRRPGRFSAAWLAGRQRALNPLGFVATALGISSAAALLVQRDDGGRVLGALTAAVLPYCYYAAVGIVCHPILRLGGSIRRLRASIAVALFAGGGPGLLVTLTWYLAVAVRTALFGAQDSLLRGIPQWAIAPMALLTFGPFAYYLVVLTLAMAGLHALGHRRAVVAVVFSLCIIGVVLGAIHRAVRFSVGVPHFVLSTYHHIPIPDIWF